MGRVWGITKHLSTRRELRVYFKTYSGTVTIHKTMLARPEIGARQYLFLIRLLLQAKREGV